MNSGGGSVQMAISGNSLGYFFSVISRPYGSIVTLDNLNATFDGKQYFLYSYYGINVVLNGDNSITCKNFEYAIYTFNQLKLSGDGTLTVTTNSSAERGIGGTNYTSESAPQALAADENHTVTISDMTDNGDGTYTWTYTVTPTSK